MMIRAFPRCRRCGKPVNRADCVQVRRLWWHTPCWDDYEREVLAEAIKELAR